RIRNLVYADTMSYSSGKHDVKFGAELSHQTLAFFNGGESPGVYFFQGTYSNNAFAEFLLGYPDNVTRAQYQKLFRLTGNFWSFFVQDNVHLTRNLTVNVGLRWEINPFFDGIRGQKTGFDLVTGKLALPSNADPTAQLFAAQQFAAYRDRILFTKDIGRPNSIEYRANRDIAPRLGIAWRPFGTSNSVVRVAYGVFHVSPDGNTLNNTGNSTPFVASETAFNDPAPAAPTRTWGNFSSASPSSDRIQTRDSAATSVSPRFRARRPMLRRLR